jgi:hypothetical protein
VFGPWEISVDLSLFSFPLHWPCKAGWHTLCRYKLNSLVNFTDGLARILDEVVHEINHHRASYPYYRNHDAHSMSSHAWYLPAASDPRFIWCAHHMKCTAKTRTAGGLCRTQSANNVVLVQSASCINRCLLIGPELQKFSVLTPQLNNVTTLK